MGTFAEAVADPSGAFDRVVTDVGQFGRDVGTILGQTFQSDTLLADGQMWSDMGTATDSAIRNTPIAGELYQLGGAAVDYASSWF